MHSWTVDVQQVQGMNECVNRVLAGDLVVDVLDRLLHVDANDRINVTVGENCKDRHKEALCLQGVVLAEDKGLSVVSCGGLLCRVPTALTMHETVVVSIVKSRRRRRDQS